MPNRLTYVPSQPVPAPGRLASAALPLADGFMRLMLSHPASGTLRSTWVTPATLWLLAVTFWLAAFLAVTVGARAAGTGALAVVGAVLCVAYAAGAGAVLVVALDQRRRAG